MWSQSVKSLRNVLHVILFCVSHSAVKYFLDSISVQYIYYNILGTRGVSLHIVLYSTVYIILWVVRPCELSIILWGVSLHSVYFIVYNTNTGTHCWAQLPLITYSVNPLFLTD